MGWWPFGYWKKLLLEEQKAMRTDVQTLTNNIAAVKNSVDALNTRVANATIGPDDAAALAQANTDLVAAKTVLDGIAVAPSP